MKETTCWRQEVGPPWIIAADWIAILGRPLSHLPVPWESSARIPTRAASALTPARPWTQFRWLLHMLSYLNRCPVMHHMFAARNKVLPDSWSEDTEENGGWRMSVTGKTLNMWGRRWVTQLCSQTWLVCVPLRESDLKSFAAPSESLCCAPLILLCSSCLLRFKEVRLCNISRWSSCEIHVYPFSEDFILLWNSLCLVWQ